jgi:hypothetical protein
MTKLVAELAVRRVFMPLFAEDSARFWVVVAHRRAGKTVAALQRLVAAALAPGGRSGRRYGFVAPLRIQSKTVAWDYLKNFTRGIPGLEINESELRVDFPNGHRIQLYGADNPDALRGAFLDGVVLDEYAQISPVTWDQVVRPMLADRAGWAVFIGTPQGKNAFFRLFEQAASAEGWARLELRASQTGLLPPAELDAARRAMSQEAYDQEFECSFTSATRGVFFGQLMEDAEKAGRITQVPYDPALECVSAWDLGVRDATAIWIVQPAPGGALHAIDYLESAGVGLDWYAEQLRAKPYRFTDHVAPPDIEVTEFGSGRSRREIAAGLGINFRVCRPHKVLDGIEAVRVLLPRMYFDREKCARGIEALGLYRQEWDDKLQNFKPVPLHDWCSHGADAMRYFAMSDGPETSAYDFPATERINLKRRTEPDYSRGYRRASNGR